MTRYNRRVLKQYTRLRGAGLTKLDLSMDVLNSIYYTYLVTHLIITSAMAVMCHLVGFFVCLFVCLALI